MFRPTVRRETAIKRMLNFSSSSHHQISSSVDMLIIITSLWEFHATLNRAGRAIAAALHDQNQVCLLTSSDLQTRLYLVSGLQSTIDLTFVHQDLPNAAIYGGPNIGRDRMFFCHSLNESRAPSCWFSELN